MALKDIDTIIIVMLENRSFDHALGYLSMGTDGAAMPVEGLVNNAQWLAQYANSNDGKLYPLRRLKPGEHVIDDPPHEQKTINTQINTPTASGQIPQMGGFVQSYATRDPAAADLGLAMGYYGKDSVPVFEFFARNFTTCDHWFAALPTGTQANRLMAMSGTSSIVDNAPFLLQDQNLVYDWLNSHGVAWAAYQAGDFLPFFALMPCWQGEIATSLVLSEFGGRSHFRRYKFFDAHWKDNTKPMPSVVFIEPEYTDGPHADPNDDHPPTGIAHGQLLLASIYSTLISNPTRWAKTMMIVTYDEHGGFFDHVPPPEMQTMVHGFPFKTRGVRVPALVISPLVQAAAVYPGNLDHTSILQLFADRFAGGVDYSHDVALRQDGLVSLGDVIGDPVQGAPRTPAIPTEAISALKQAASAAPAPARGTGAAGATANEQAFDNAARQIALQHPELIAEPAWGALTDYLKSGA
jgi:phospholipase C